MRCRNFKFQLGKTTKYPHTLAICERGFHFCKEVAHLARYKDFSKSRLFIIKYGANTITKGDKVVADEITLVEEITAPSLLRMLCIHAYKAMLLKNAFGILLFLCHQSLAVDKELLNALVTDGALTLDNTHLFELASRYGHLAVVELLVKRGVNVHVHRDYALRWASQCGHSTVVEFLVSRGANIHANDDYALRWASICGHLQVVKFLVQQGANIHAKKGHALKYGATNVATWLRRVAAEESM